MFSEQQVEQDIINPFRKLPRALDPHQRSGVSALHAWVLMLAFGTHKNGMHDRIVVASRMLGAFDAALDEYIQHLRVERGLSRHTVEGYASDLSQAWSMAGRSEHIVLDGVDESVVAGFLITLSQRGLSARTQARALSSIRGFFRFLVEERRQHRDPTELLEGPKLLSKLPDVLNRDEVFRLLQAPAGDKPNRVRDRAMLHTMYAAGLRVSELVGLNLGDVNLDDGFIAALGKGNKRRIVPLGAPSRAAMAQYLTDVRPKWARPSERACFVTARGKPMTRQSFWAIVKKYARAAGHYQADFTAQASSLVRDTPARGRRGPALGCRPCSGTPTSRRRRSIPTSVATICAGCTNDITLEGNELPG